MLSPETVGATFLKAEHDEDDGARSKSPEFFGPMVSSAAANTTTPAESMEQDGTTLPLSVQPSVSPLTSFSSPTTIHAETSGRALNTPPGPVLPTPITSQTVTPQVNVGSSLSSTLSANKPLFFTTSSPNKLIAIQGSAVPRFVQGIPAIPRIQIVPAQSKMTTQTTLRPIAPRCAPNTSISATRSQIQLIQAAPRAVGKQVISSQPGSSVVQSSRIVVQARSGSTGLRAIAPNLTNLPHGTTIQLPAGTIIKDGIVYVPQPVQPGSASSGMQLSTVQISPAVSSVVQPVNGVQEPSSPTRQRKPCNCTKSQCLKLYCDCFANGEFCNNCNCNNCSNNMEHEEDRSKAIKACLERNPHAFHPKIGKGKGETERRHNKGCHCKRSGCLKNYCECYEAKILCTNICKCTGCKNFEESPERKTLMHLADAAEVRVQQQNAAKTKLESQMEDLPSRAPILAHAGEKLPFSFVTRDVVEATCRCLLVQASAAEKKNMSKSETQNLILEEFGNCLLKIIHTASSQSAS